MATAGKIGYGTLLKRGNAASPEVFTTLAEVRKIGSFGSKAGLVDMTNFDSANGFMEYLAAMKDGVQMTIECNFIPTNATQGTSSGMIADHNAGTVRNFQLVLAGSLGTFSFAGIVLEWNVPSLAPQDAITVSFGVKITGTISYV
jgi:hypothetical protein